MIVLEQHEHEQYVGDMFYPPYEHIAQNYTGRERDSRRVNRGDRYYIVKTTPENAIVVIYDDCYQEETPIPWDIVFKQMFDMPNMSVVISLVNI